LKVIAGAGVEPLVREHGGRLFVWTDPHRCCSGGVTLLDTGWSAHDGKDFERERAEGFELWFAASGRTPPDELHLEVRGIRHKRIAAYWNGCVFAI